jgi:hypothetical protein
MGREIVYCEGCGNSLREADFERGRARTLDNKPYCTTCKPYLEGEEGPPPKRPSSGRIAAQPAPRKNPTGSVPVVPGARRPGPAAPKAQSNPLPIIAGVGGVLLLLVIVAVSQGTTRRPPATEPPAPAPAPIEIPAPRPSADAPPRDPPPRDPLPPPPRREPPPVSPSTKTSDPLVAPSAAEKLEAFLAQIRQRIQEDQRKERAEEILRMCAVAAKIAGPRLSEVEKLKADYIATLDEPARLAALWSDWKITSSTEPGSTGLLPTYGDRANVYMTHPLRQGVPATLEREVDVPTGKTTRLSFWVSCHLQGDFELRVFADGKSLLKEVIGPKGSGWKEKSVDLTSFAGRRIALRLENFPNSWDFEHAYWSDVKVVSD